MTAAAPSKEPLVVIVGFLGAGKTTLLSYLVDSFLENSWDPYVILNDYENAFLDAQQVSEKIVEDAVKPLNGSCICCSGINELREFVNRIPTRDKGITLIEANGTSDACALMGFLGVGIDERFRPPVQISVVDAKNWQKRELNNELEANQIQVSSLVVLTHLSDLAAERKQTVENEVMELNPTARIVVREDLKELILSGLEPSGAEGEKMDHQLSHWASCSADLPELPHVICIDDICRALPQTILRIKGCTSVSSNEGFTYFERCPDGTVYIRPYRGIPKTGPKLVAIGPGSHPEALSKAINSSIEKFNQRKI